MSEKYSSAGCLKKIVPRLCSLRADFTIVEEFEGEKEKVKSAHSLQLFRSRDKSYPPSLLYKDQSRSVFDFSKVLFSLTLHLIG